VIWCFGFGDEPGTGKSWKFGQPINKALEKGKRSVHTSM